MLVTIKGAIDGALLGQCREAASLAPMGPEEGGCVALGFSRAELGLGFPAVARHWVGGAAITVAAATGTPASWRLVRAAAGVGADMVRLSVGIEDVADLQADLEAGLECAARVAVGRGSSPNEFNLDGGRRTENQLPLLKRSYLRSASNRRQIPKQIYFARDCLYSRSLLWSTCLSTF